MTRFVVPMLAVVATLALVLTARWSQAQENDYLIVPGKRVGRWELGKPLEEYGFGQPNSHWAGEDPDRTVYYDGYVFRELSSGLELYVFSCKSDNSVFALMPRRRVDRSSEATDAVKYKTAQGVSIGAREEEVLRLLGSPVNTEQWTERHGTIEVKVKNLNYTGLRVLVNQSDQKVFAVGATTFGAWPTCHQAVLKALTVASGYSDVPLPTDIRILQPGPGVPRERAVFSGRWAGQWDGGRLSSMIVVEEINLVVNRIVVVYAWGSGLSGGTPGWRRTRGLFQESQLTFRFEFSREYEALVSLRHNPDDTLEGTWTFMYAPTKYITNVSKGGFRRMER